MYASVADGIHCHCLDNVPELSEHSIGSGNCLHGGLTCLAIIQCKCLEERHHMCKLQAKKICVVHLMGVFHQSCQETGAEVRHLASC